MMSVVLSRLLQRIKICATNACEWIEGVGTLNVGMNADSDRVLVIAVIVPSDSHIRIDDEQSWCTALREPPTTLSMYALIYMYTRR